MQKYREGVVIGIIGTRGTGKTATTEALVRKWIRNNPTGLVYGFVPDPRSKLHQYINVYINGNDPNWAIPLFNLTNCLILLDDYVGLMKSAKGSQVYIPTPGMIDLFTRGRFSSNDIIFSCHSARSVIPALAEYTTHYYIFKTATDEGKFDSRMYGGPKLIKCAKLVNAYCSMIKSKGYHWETPEFQKTGQGFPHIVLNTITMEPTPYYIFEHVIKGYQVKNLK